MNLNHASRVIKFQGGLGNQFFQFALILVLQKKGYKTLADISEYSKFKMHSGFLIETIFNTKLDMACDDDIKLLKDHRNDIFSLIKRKILKKFKDTHLTRYSENIEKVFTDKKSYYLDGYWQNETFIKLYDVEIKDNLSSFSIKDNSLDPIYKNIVSSNSVAVHIRRGDYLSVKNRKIYSFCSKEYYTKAIEEIKNRVNNPKFYFFSDDMDWVRENFNNCGFNLDFVNYDYSNKAISDLFLMKTCKHQITANSTYSWWAAFLNTNKSKIVITPKNWMVDYDRDKEIYRPTEWIEVNNLENK